MLRGEPVGEYWQCDFNYSSDFSTGYAGGGAGAVMVAEPKGEGGRDSRNQVLPNDVVALLEPETGRILWERSIGFHDKEWEKLVLSKTAGPQGDGQTQHTNHQQDNITKQDPKHPFKEARSFKNSIVMVSVSGNAAVQVMQAAAQIPDEELGADGRENDPHVTIKFGVKDDPELLKATLKSITPFSVRLGKVKVFIPSESSGRQAPVVAEALAPQLKMLHDKVDAAMSARPDDFPFSPHVTLAYLKPEVAKKYEGSDMVEGLSFLVDHVVLSRSDRSKIEISLEQAKAVSAADHKFAPDRGHGREDVLVAVDPAKLDAEWSKDSGFYVGPGGEGGIHGRYERFQRWLQDNPETPIGAPIVSWNDVLDLPSFTNGRHRFAVLRDMGVKKVYISVPKYQKEIFKKFASHKTPPLSDTQYQNMNDTSGEGTNAYADIRERVKDTREETPLEVLNPTLFKDASDPDVFHYQLKKALGQLTPEEDDFPKTLYHGTSVPAAQAIMHEGFSKFNVWWTTDYGMATYYAKLKASDPKDPQEKYAILKLDALKAKFRPINLRLLKGGDNVIVSHWPIPQEAFIGYDSHPFDGNVDKMPSPKRGAAKIALIMDEDPEDANTLRYITPDEDAGDDFDFGGQAHRLAQKVGINILSDKEAACFAVMGDIVVGALFVSTGQNAFSFDIVVDPEFQGQGIGRSLVNEAESEYRARREAFGDDYRMQVDVVNPKMKDLLLSKGYTVEKQQGGKFWLMTKQAKGKKLGDVYLLHFNIEPGTVIQPTRPDAKKPFHARHYLGWAESAESRILQHEEGTAARLTQHLKSLGISFTPAKIWHSKTRDFERALKNQGGLSRHCPICISQGIDRDSIGRKRREEKVAPETSTTGPDFVETASVESRNATPALLADVEAQTIPYKVPGYAGEHRLWDDSVFFSLSRTIHGAYLTDLHALHPKQGDGHRFMEWLKGIADKHGVEIHGYADPVGTEGLDTDQLLNWYKRHGFVFMDGRRMVRQPRTAASVPLNEQYVRWIDLPEGTKFGWKSQLHWQLAEDGGYKVYTQFPRGTAEIDHRMKKIILRGYNDEWPSNTAAETFRHRFPKYEIKELALPTHVSPDAVMASEKEAAPKDWILPTALALGLGAPPAATPSVTPPAPPRTHHEQVMDPKAQNMEKLMVAIGRAEGARPERHNPGNLADINGNIRTFKTDAEGKAALKQQLERISQGVHPHIKPNHTLEQAGLIYSDGDPNWAHNVSLIMRVPKNIKMKDLIDGKYTPRPPKKHTGAIAPTRSSEQLAAEKPIASDTADGIRMDIVYGVDEQVSGARSDFQRMGTFFLTDLATGEKVQGGYFMGWPEHPRTQDEWAVMSLEDQAMEELQHQKKWGYRDIFDFQKKHRVKTGADAAPMSLLQALVSLRPQFVAVAQQTYDENVSANVEDPDGEHGICDEIAREIQGVIVAHVGGVEVSEGGQDGDDHAWVIAYRGKEVYGIDIAPSVYESGGGYSWKLNEGVKIQPTDVEIFKLDIDPEQLKTAKKDIVDPEDLPLGDWEKEVIKKPFKPTDVGHNLYHGTSSVYLDKINKAGLRAHTYVTQDFYTASIEAHGTTHQDVNGKPGVGGNPVIVRIDPAKMSGHLFADPEYLGGADKEEELYAFYTDHPVPRSAIVEILERKAVQEGDETKRLNLPGKSFIDWVKVAASPNDLTPEEQKVALEKLNGLAATMDSDYAQAYNQAAVKLSDLGMIDDGWGYQVHPASLDDSVGRLKTIPLAGIGYSNAAQDATSLAGLKAYIQRQPDPKKDGWPEVAQTPDGKYHVISGHTRLGAVLLSGRGTAKARVYQYDQEGNLIRKKTAAAPPLTKEILERVAWEVRDELIPDGESAGYCEEVSEAIVEKLHEMGYTNAFTASGQFLGDVRHPHMWVRVGPWEVDATQDQFAMMQDDPEKEAEYAENPVYIGPPRGAGYAESFYVGKKSSMKTALQVEVPKSVREHFWEEPPVGNLEFWAYRHPVNILPGEKIVFTFDGAPIARAVCHHTEAPGQSECENTGKYKNHHKVYWDPKTFVRLDGK